MTGKGNIVGKIKKPDDPSMRSSTSLSPIVVELAIANACSLSTGRVAGRG